MKTHSKYHDRYICIALGKGYSSMRIALRITAICASAIVASR